MICGLLVAEGWPVNKKHRAFVAPRRPSCGAPDEGQTSGQKALGEEREQHLEAATRATQSHLVL